MQLLGTKFHIPLPSGPLVSRPRLYEALDRCLAKKLTLLSAPAGLGNPLCMVRVDIAEKRGISLSTVKGHNQNIFAKLGVLRRTEAIARARELGLLK